MRIHSVELFTTAPLTSLQAFYGGDLGLPVSSQETALQIRIGSSRLTFVAAPEGTEPAPFYHLAFNIPPHKLLAARRWQLERTPLILPQELDGLDLRDPNLPEDVAHYRLWNAHSVFFWDPAGNLLEHIARHDLDGGVRNAPRAAAEQDAEAFDGRDLQSISEIGLVVDDVPEERARLCSDLGLTQYRQASDEFAALGDEEGLVVLLGRGRTLGFGEGKPGAPFPLQVTLGGIAPHDSQAPYELAGYPYRIWTTETESRASGT